MSNALIVKPLPVTATANSTAPGYDPSYVGNDYLGVVWRSVAGASVADLTVDLGVDRAIDTALLLGCDGADTNWTLAVAANTAAIGADFTSPSYSGAAASFLAGTNMLTSGRGVALWTAPAGFPAAVRYLRFRIRGMGAGQATVARAVVGKRIQFAHNFSNGVQLGVRELGGVDFSRTGNLLRKRGTKLRTLGLSFQSVLKDEVEAIMQPLLEQIGGTETLAIVTDPDADPNRQRRAFFGPLVGELATTQRKAQFWQAQLQLVSLI